MDTDYINGLALKCGIREVLSSARALRTRDTARDDSDAAFTQTDGVFEMRCYVAEPRLSSHDWMDARPGLILDIDFLNRISYGSIV